MTEAELRAQRRYGQKCRMFVIRLRKDRDADIIDWLEMKKADPKVEADGGMTEYLRTLIRGDMGKKVIAWEDVPKKS